MAVSAERLVFTDDRHVMQSDGIHPCNTSYEMNTCTRCTIMDTHMPGISFLAPTIKSFAQPCMVHIQVKKTVLTGDETRDDR